MKVRQILCVALVALLAGTSFGQITSMNENLAILPGSITTNIFATTTGDIVSLEDVTLTLESGEIYNLGAPFGSDTSDACPDFCGFEPLAEADSYITTPGDTNVLVNDGSDAIQPDRVPLSTWADFTDDGPQNNFQIARITLQSISESNDSLQGTLQGTLQFVGQAGGIDSLPFSVTVGVPEPASAVLSLIAGLVVFAIRRRS